MKWYIKVLNQYADFEGRARRKEYWMFTLFNIIFIFLAQSIDNLIGITFDLYGIPLGFGYVYLLYTLALFIPSLAVVVRRLHDVGKSGWMYLLIFIPLIGFIWLFVLAVTNGDKGDNKYGKDPKEA